MKYSKSHGKPQLKDEELEELNKLSRVKRIDRFKELWAY